MLPFWEYARIGAFGRALPPPFLAFKRFYPSAPGWRLCLIWKPCPPFHADRLLPLSTRETRAAIPGERWAAFCAAWRDFRERARRLLPGSVWGMVRDIHGPFSVASCCTFVPWRDLAPAGR